MGSRTHVISQTITHPSKSCCYHGAFQLLVKPKKKKKTKPIQSKSKQKNHKSLISREMLQQRNKWKIREDTNTFFWPLCMYRKLLIHADTYMYKKEILSH